VLAAIEHVDERLADLGPRSLFLEQDPGDATHGRDPPHLLAARRRESSVRLI
jgi:hypothetical protein